VEIVVRSRHVSPSASAFLSHLLVHENRTRTISGTSHPIARCFVRDALKIIGVPPLEINHRGPVVYRALYKFVSRHGI